MNVLSMDLLNRVKQREETLLSLVRLNLRMEEIRRELIVLDRNIGEKRAEMNRISAQILNSISNINTKDFFKDDEEEYIILHRSEERQGLDVLKENNIDILEEIKDNSQGYISKCAEEKIEWIKRNTNETC